MRASDAGLCKLRRFFKSTSTAHAQSMDLPSLRARIAGYSAVIIAAGKYQCCVPMLMAAAGGGASIPNT